MTRQPIPLVPICYCGRPTVSDGAGGYVCPAWRRWRPWERHRHGALTIPAGGAVDMVGNVPAEAFDQLGPCPSCGHQATALCHTEAGSPSCACDNRPTLRPTEAG